MKPTKIAALISSLIFSWASSVHAQSGIWINTAGGSWTNSANWDSGIIADGADNNADFTTLALPWLGANASVTLDGPRTIGNLAFDSTGPTTNYWSLSNGFAGPLTLSAGGSPSITVNLGVTNAVIGANLAGVNGFSKNGNGRLNLAANNSSLSGGIFINSGPTVATGSSGTASNAAVIVSHPNALGSGAVTIAAVSLLRALEFNLTGGATVNNDINLPTSTATQIGMQGNGSASAFTLAGKLSGGYAGLELRFDMGNSGSTGVVRLSNPANDFRASSIHMWRGMLAITDNSVLGNSLNTINLDQGAAAAMGLRFDAPNIIVSRPVAVSSSPTGLDVRGDNNGDGTVDTSNDATIAGNITGASTLTYKGGITTSGNSSGSITLSGNNTFTAAGTISASTKVIAASVNALGTVAGATTVSAGGTLAFKNVGSYSLNEPVTLNGIGVQVSSAGVGALENLTGNNIFNGPITLATSSTIGVTAGTMNLGGVISGVVGSTLTKVGSGPLTLNANNTYLGGTVVTAGKLTMPTPKTGGGGISLSNSTTLGINVNSATSVPTAALTLGSGGATTLDFNFNVAPSLTVAPIIATNLIPNGGVASVSINLTGTLVVAQFPLIKFTAGSIPGNGFNAFQLGTLPPYVVANLVSNGVNSSIDLNITAINQPLWSGALSSEWSTNLLALPKNWVAIGNGTTPIDYAEGIPPNTVLFNDAAAGSTTVNVSVAPVAPAAVTFNNSAKDYTLTGSQGIVGSIGVTKSGTGLVTLLNTNTFTGRWPSMAARWLLLRMRRWGQFLERPRRGRLF